MKDNKSQMENTYFMLCVSGLKCDTGNDTDAVGMTGTWSPYEVSFYAEKENGYKDLIVEDFGLMKDGKWIQMEPTDKQLSIMKSQLNAQIDEVNDNLERIRVDEQKDQEPYYASYEHLMGKSFL